MLKQPMTQYSAQFSNDSGKLTKLTRLLAKEKIDAKSVTTAKVGKISVVQFLAHKDTELRRKLEKIGCSVQETEVLQFEMPNHPWELHKLAQTLAKGRINVISLRGIVEGQNLRMVLAVDQPPNAVDLIADLGFHPDYAVA